jgi:hypothetical protein
MLANALIEHQEADRRRFGRSRHNITATRGRGKPSESAGLGFRSTPLPDGLGGSEPEAQKHSGLVWKTGKAGKKPKILFSKLYANPRDAGKIDSDLSIMRIIFMMKILSTIEIYNSYPSCSKCPEIDSLVGVSTISLGN